MAFFELLLLVFALFAVFPFALFGIIRIWKFASRFMGVDTSRW